MSDAHCSICSEGLVEAVATGIRMCVYCDSGGEFIWPTQYYEWVKGMAYPGAEDNG